MRVEIFMHYAKFAIQIKLGFFNLNIRGHEDNLTMNTVNSPNTP